MGTEAQLAILMEDNYNGSDKVTEDMHPMEKTNITNNTPPPTPPSILEFAPSRVLANVERVVDGLNKSIFLKFEFKKLKLGEVPS